MIDGFDVRGTEQLEDLGRALRAAGTGGKGLRNELYRGVNSVSKPIRNELVDSISEALPQRGGLARTFESAARFNASPKMSGKFVGVTIWGKARGHDMRTLTGKRLRHPVYGNRRNWVNQTAGVDPTAVPQKFESQRDRVREAVYEVIATVRSKIYRSV